MRLASLEQIEQRRNEARRLHGQGLSYRSIAKALGVSKTQVSRDIAAIPKASPTPTPQTNGKAPEDALEDDQWQRIESFAIQELVRQAKEGSVPASVQLIRMSREERQAANVRRCAGHHTDEDVNEARLAVWNGCIAHFRDALPNRLVAQFGLSYVEVHSVVLDALERAYRDLIGEREGEQEAA